jgi:hypothetical protein
MIRFPDDQTPNDGLPECDSRDAVNLDIAGPEDNTIRPCRPERRAFLEAERQKLIRWGTLASSEEGKEEK